MRRRIVESESNQNLQLSQQKLNVLATMQHNIKNLISLRVGYIHIICTEQFLACRILGLLLSLFEVAELM